MPVLREIPRAEVKDEIILGYYNKLFHDRDPVSEPGTSTGTHGDWWTVFAQSPDVFNHAVAGFRLYRGSARKVDPVLRELGQTRAGWNKASQFVFSQHCKSLRGLGVDEAKIKNIDHWEIADCYNEKERTVLAYTDYLTVHEGRVPKAIYDKLKSFLTEEMILEITYIIMLYDMHAVMTRALRLEFDDREDPITEVEAPEGFAAADWMGGGPNLGGPANKVKMDPRVMDS